MSISEWHYVDGGTSVGPLTQAQMDEAIASGRIGANTLVWNDTLPQWEPAAIHFDAFRTGQAPRQAYGSAGLSARHDGLYEGAPARGFGEAVQVCLRKYVDFSGRASRSEFWYFVLFSFILGFITGFIDEIMLMSSGAYLYLNDILSLALFLPSLAVSFRRLHDIDRTGWWVGAPYLVMLGLVIYGSLMAASVTSLDALSETLVLSFFAFVVLGLIYMVVMLVFYCTKGTPGPNRYG